MRKILHAEERDFLLFHGAFTLICALVLAAPGPAIGVKLLILSALYVTGLPFYAVLRGRNEWTGMWLFSLVLSIFQVFPDWFLSAQLGVLVFPEDGLVKFGSVSAYMAGLWTIPIFIILFAGRRMAERVSPNAGTGAAAIAAFVIFVVSEQTSWMLPSWYARDVFMIGHVAVYIIVPEIVLGASCFWMYDHIRGKGHLAKVPAAFMVMQLYLGSAALFYFIVERLLRG